MKALKSSWTKAALSDPEARARLKRYLVKGGASFGEPAKREDVIEVVQDGRKVRLFPSVVPKAE